MNHQIKTLLTSSAFLVNYSVAHAAVSVEVSGIQTQIVGSVTSVPSSGVTQNFTTSTVGDYAVFDMVDVTGGGSTDFADLKVSYESDNGSVGSSIMIAQTVDSQGLTDPGTISVLIFNRETPGTVTLKFEWFQPDSFLAGFELPGAALIDDPIKYTTFDIDFNQIVSMPTDQLAEVNFFGATELSQNVVGPDTVITDNGSNTVVDDPATAVSLLTEPGGSHSITVGKQTTGFALFMFEFRDTSEVIPEPSIALFGFLGLGLVMTRRRC